MSLASEIGCESLESLPRDVSPREYYRGKRGDLDFILMRYPEITDETKAELRQFIRIDHWLVEQGIKAPELYEEHVDKGYALMEDLGGTSFGKALKAGHDRTDLYTLATDALKHLRTCDAPDYLPAFSESRIRANIRQLVDYYIPITRSQLNEKGLAQEYLDIWTQIEHSLPPCPQGFLHADYHLENLMLMEKQDGIKKCALIDFQDALNGPIPYDLVNLLEDARMDVPTDLSETLMSRYCEGMTMAEEEAFRLWYRVLGTQFHCRVIGLFIKLSAEQNRDDYLIHIERLQKYLKKHIKHPVLEPLKRWFDKEGLDFAPVKDLNGESIRTVFRNIKY